MSTASKPARAQKALLRAVMSEDKVFANSPGSRSVQPSAVSPQRAEEGSPGLTADGCRLSAAPAHTSKAKPRPAISASDLLGFSTSESQLSSMRYNSQLGLANPGWDCIVHPDAGGLGGKPSWILARITTVGILWIPSPLPATWSRPSCFWYREGAQTTNPSRGGTRFPRPMTGNQAHPGGTRQSGNRGFHASRHTQGVPGGEGWLRRGNG